MAINIVQLLVGFIACEYAKIEPEIGPILQLQMFHSLHDRRTFTIKCLKRGFN